MGYIDRLDEWRKKAEEKAKELEEKFKLKDKLDDSLRAAESAVKKGVETVGDAAKTGVEAVGESAQRLQDEFARIEDQYNIREHVRTASEKAGKAFKQGSQKANEVVSDFGGKAKDYGEKAKDYYEKASDAYNFSQAATKATASVAAGVEAAVDWAKANPAKAALTAASVLAGMRIGFAFPSLDEKIFGVKGHWFFRSAILAYTSRKLSEKYRNYLNTQQELLQAGRLSEAERARVEFQMDAAKFVGAPLLGAFNIASGLAIWGEIFSPGRIVGFPIDILLGGNPVMETIFLFSNGLICIHNGYEFIMMAVADQEEVERIVRDIKGLLPEASVA